MPRRAGPIQKRTIPNVKRVIAVASGKGGVGKSTVAVNLAFALSSLRPPDSTARLRVGVLDLDIFGPSIPTLMGLQNSEEPLLTPGGAIIPLMNHGIPTMSMGFLLPRSPDTNSTNDTPVVWRGLMVQKAVQQLLFDVDWKDGQGLGLDVLVIDMPPGTGDVPLTLGQLVIVDGAVIVSTPQDVALADVSKGIAMLRKVSVPISGIVLNQSHFMCPGCEARHYLYGPPEAFRATAARLGVDILAELPLVPGVSQGGDAGLPYSLLSSTQHGDPDGLGGSQWLKEMGQVAEKIWLSMR
ncbi:P-loop containing nucleoside triphosphate hydrolase protein [Mycena latifolia]|nr:P-loop containing nucleoside triphosphate hydrolase protein [Mycena latifolia]